MSSRLPTRLNIRSRVAAWGDARAEIFDGEFRLRSGDHPGCQSRGFQP